MERSIGTMNVLFAKNVEIRLFLAASTLQMKKSFAVNAMDKIKASFAANVESKLKLKISGLITTISTTTALVFAANLATNPSAQASWNMKNHFTVQRVIKSCFLRNVRDVACQLLEMV